MKPLRVLTYPGIGDFSWCYSKLVSLGRPLDVCYMAPSLRKKRQRRPRRRQMAPVDNRLAQLLDLLPLVKSYSARSVDKHRLVLPPQPLAALVGAVETYFGVNTHLEQGQRIETYAPDLATNFHYDLKLTPQMTALATKLLDKRTDYLLLYTSAKQGIERWQGWGPSKWELFVKLFRKQYGPVPVVITGADWDRNMTIRLARVLGNALDLSGQTDLGTTLELIRMSRYFAGFASGLCVMANVIRAPVYMFYPKHLEPMINTWADPADIESGAYIGSLWCEPEAAMERVTRFLGTS